jgi:hypothetical protein
LLGNDVVVLNIVFYSLCVALSLSNRLYDAMVRVKTDIQRLAQGQRSQMSRLESDYSVQLAVARNHYRKKRRAFDEKKLATVLPSRYGQPLTGTLVIQNFARRSPDAGQVADSLADVVDAVEGIALGLVRNEVFTEEFVPPPMPPGVGEDHASALAKQSAVITAKLRASEDERTRCWKKMLKTKAEFEMPSSGRRMDPNRFNAMPAPALRTSTSQTLPRQVERPAEPTYTPAARPKLPFPPPQPQYQQHVPENIPPDAGAGSKQSLSESKYSMSRVKERIAADGTVAPVSEPKMTKDGLYQRPAGRTRKGMEWDAVRGIWVPSTIGDFD